MSTTIPAFTVGNDEASAQSSARRNLGRWATGCDDLGRPFTSVYLVQPHLQGAGVAELTRIARRILRSQFPSLRGGTLALHWQATIENVNGRTALYFRYWPATRD